MTEKPPKKEVVNMRGPVTLDTHKALRAKQWQIEQATGTKPMMTDVVGIVLNDWARLQAA